MTRSPTIARLILVIGILTVALGEASRPQYAEAQSRHVVVNGAVLGPEALAAADRAAGLRLPDGAYWYDERSGLWGPLGGPPVGRVTPHDRSPPAAGWSWRNDVTGEGVIMNPDGATWQDRVWVSPR